MSKASAKTIKGLSILGEKRLTVAETTVGSRFLSLLACLPPSI